MSEPTELRLMKLAAARASQDQRFLGYFLEGYKRIRLVGSRELAALLGCNADDLYSLALCSAPPRQTGAPFREYVHNIASSFLLNQDKLAELLRTVLSIEQMQPAALSAISPLSQRQQIALAARDREDEAAEETTPLPPEENGDVSEHGD